VFVAIRFTLNISLPTSLQVNILIDMATNVVELEMQVKKIRNENSVLLQEAVEPHYIHYIVAKD